MKGFALLSRPGCVVRRPEYDFHRALWTALPGKTQGAAEAGDALFQARHSTLSEPTTTMRRFSLPRDARGGPRVAHAFWREPAHASVLAPRERPWFQEGNALLKHSRSRSRPISEFCLMLIGEFLIVSFSLKTQTKNSEPFPPLHLPSDFGARDGISEVGPYPALTEEADCTSSWRPDRFARRRSPRRPSNLQPQRPWSRLQKVAKRSDQRHAETCVLIRSPVVRARRRARAPALVRSTLARRVLGV